MQQCMVYDLENDLTHGAILLENGDAICACCGSILPEDELGETWKIIEKYDEWVDFSNAICAM